VGQEQAEHRCLAGGRGHEVAIDKRAAPGGRSSTTPWAWISRAWVVVGAGPASRHARPGEHDRLWCPDRQGPIEWGLGCPPGNQVIDLPGDGHRVVGEALVVATDQGGVDRRSGAVWPAWANRTSSRCWRSAWTLASA
jgi:hypothetical protein